MVCLLDSNRQALHPTVPLRAELVSLAENLCETTLRAFLTAAPAPPMNSACGSLTVLAIATFGKGSWR
jgi:hypothetical protein